MNSYDKPRVLRQLSPKSISSFSSVRFNRSDKLLLLLLLSCITCVQLCNPIDSSPPGSPVSGILQAGTLEWVAISFSNAWKWKAKVKSLSHVRLLATPWTTAHQASPSMGVSRQEYWSGVPSPSPSEACTERLILQLAFHWSPLADSSSFFWRGEALNINYYVCCLSFPSGDVSSPKVEIFDYFVHWYTWRA